MFKVRIPSPPSPPPFSLYNLPLFPKMGIRNEFGRIHLSIPIPFVSFPFSFFPLFKIGFISSKRLKASRAYLSLSKNGFQETGINDKVIKF